MVDDVGDSTASREYWQREAQHWKANYKVAVSNWSLCLDLLAEIDKMYPTASDEAWAKVNAKYEAAEKMSTAESPQEKDK